MTTWPLGPGVVEFPDGRRVRGRGLRRSARDDLTPEFGLCLASRDPGPFAWPYAWIEWPDFRLPTDRGLAGDLIAAAHARAISERVEVACGGGVGRTGTTLAVMAVLSGVDPVDAVDWVRSSYHKRAVETLWQRRWVSTVRQPT